MEKKQLYVGFSANEWILSVVFAMALFTLASWVDAFEWIYEATRQYEDYNVDEIFMLLSSFSIVFTVVLLRRWQQLERLNNEVKRLQTLIPICANCKKVKNDEGYYEAVDAYFEESQLVKFTHGICKDCAKKLYNLDLDSKAGSNES